MKRRKMGLLLAAALALTACQGTVQAEPQEYVSEDGWFTVTLPEGMSAEQSLMLTDYSMLTIEEENGSGAIVVEIGKDASVGGATMASLDEYQKWTDTLFESTGVQWETIEPISVEGFVNGLEASGTMTVEGVTSPLYGQYLESGYRYYAVILVGSKRDLERMRSVLSIRESDPPPETVSEAGQSGTVGFISAMSAVVDSLNGINCLTLTLPEGEGYEEQMQTICAQTLEESWGITDAQGLFETADSLIAGTHNPDALAVLEEYCAGADMSREELETQMDADLLDESSRVFLLAAYDARTAYGDHAILAWDLSRVPTIMGLGYQAGMCTYEEAMDQCLTAAKAAQSAFRSWEEFNQSYLYGYSYWAEEDLADPASGAGQRAAIVEQLKAEGMYDIDWDQNLEREW